WPTRERRCRRRSYSGSRSRVQKLAGSRLLAGDGDKFLNAFAVFDFARVDIALRVHGDGVDPVKLAGIMACAAERPHELSVVAIEDPHHVVGAVRDQNMFLLGIGGKREVIHRAARRISHAPDSAAVRAARLCRGVNPELLHKFALLGEYLNPVAAAFADVDKTVARRMRTMERRCKLLLVGWRTRYVIGWRRIVVDLAQRGAVASPAALEGPCIHVVDEHALVEKTVGNIDFASIFVEFEGCDAGRKNRGLLVILFHL